MVAGKHEGDAFVRSSYGGTQCFSVLIVFINGTGSVRVLSCFCAHVCASVAREALTAVLRNQTQNSTVVLVGSSAGGIGAFNVVSWLLDTFEQVRAGLATVKCMYCTK